MRALLSSIAVLSASVAYVAWQTLSGGTARANTPTPATAQPATAAPTRALAQPTAVAVQPTAVAPTAAAVQPTAVQPAPVQQAPLQPVTAQASSAQPTVVSAPQDATPPTAVAAQPTAVPAQPTRVPATTVPTRVPASPTTAVAAKSALHDGTWTSDAIQTNWGPIQVEMVVENGRITDVASVQYPQSRSRSLQISRSALPVYAEQVVSMQSARVNSMSGATQTARGFQQAVQTAIQKAS